MTKELTANFMKGSQEIWSGEQKSLFLCLATLVPTALYCSERTVALGTPARLWPMAVLRGVQLLTESERNLDQEVSGNNMASKQQIENFTEEVICPICLDFFTDPVSLDCGHNFCRPCITEYWKKGTRNICPECREEFQEITLRGNRALVRLADKARKLKLSPIETESDLHCEEHEEELKLFCETDKTLICLICRDAREHKSHNFMPINEAVEVYKEQVKSSFTSLTERKSAILKMEQQQKQKISEIRDQTRSLESHISSEFTRMRQCLTDKEQRLIRDLKIREKMVVGQMEKTLREIQSNLTSIEEEISKLHKQMEQTDGVIFLKEECCQKRRVGNIQTLTITDGALTLGEFNGPLPFPVWREMFDDIQPVSVTLDVETANQRLELSADRKSVRRIRTRRDVPDTRKRFTAGVSVLGSEGFTTGRCYWEVEVAGNRRWSLGVAVESVERKEWVALKPEAGVWTIGRSGDRFVVNGCPDPRFPAGPIPRRVGIYLSYEAGTVSFYKVETKSHLHTFTGNKFMEKLYPFFWIGDENKWLIIYSGSDPGLQRVECRDWR
ncbi:zinc-binding protein A33-like [Hypanus sabinus]|uniref:zinc-binding protein A33-like n=1 Tax=Hypanus sabinus TaxID=79690 RepID=UPI0028C3A9B8|nr:zinc-binding protein A33-like [Hypanus sabinus]